ncbi:MAG TPA: DUF2071 domain-containing protein, partial [Myxococcota bacterium]|nr:DUF2071 domain-containing protein [Myxococcota bacterium]
VPRRATAWVARVAYGENYVAHPMRHSLRVGPLEGRSSVSYGWKRSGAWEGLSLEFSGEPERPADDSEEAFISEHYRGYARQADGGSIEYRVEHPRWNVWRAQRARLECDVAALYGREFAGALRDRPSSAFLADGSPVVVRRGRRL